MPTILVLLAVVVACGDGDSSASDEPLPTPILEGASATLVDLLTQGLESTFKVTYQTTSPEGVEGDRYFVVHRQTITRIDTIPANSSEPSSLIIGGAGAAPVSCSGGPDDWQCFEIEPLGDSLLIAAGPIIYLSATDVDSFEVRETEGRRVVGQAARCFRLSPRQGETGGNAEYCLSADGVPLYTKAQFGTVAATEFSVRILDQDFEPPAEPLR